MVYLAVGLVVGVESMGIPLPGEVVLVSAALLSSRQELDVSPAGVAAAAVVGAILGDSVGFAAGRRFGDRLFTVLGRRFPRQLSAAHVSWAEHVFTRYGVLAVFFGRFIALLRIFAGPLAGALRMPYRRFLVANVLGALVWAGGTTAAVYALGTVAERWLQRSAWAALLLAAVVALVAARTMHHRIEQAVADHAAAREPGRAAPGAEPDRCDPVGRGVSRDRRRQDEATTTATATAPTHARRGRTRDRTATPSTARQPERGPGRTTLLPVTQRPSREPGAPRCSTGPRGPSTVAVRPAAASSSATRPRACAGPTEPAPAWRAASCSSRTIGTGSSARTRTWVPSALTVARWPSTTTSRSAWSRTVPTRRAGVTLSPGPRRW